MQIATVAMLIFFLAVPLNGLGVVQASPSLQGEAPLLHGETQQLHVETQQLHVETQQSVVAMCDDAQACCHADDVQDYDKQPSSAKHENRSARDAASAPCEDCGGPCDNQHCTDCGCQSAALIFLHVDATAHTVLPSSPLLLLGDQNLTSIDLALPLQPPRG
ncbi:hypothetical protein KQI65_13680 [bacterium]|nr:hypothetical protein [bacterium]